MQLSVSEAARLFRVSEETIYKWVKEDNLPATRFDDRYHFSRIKLIEWAQINRIPLAIENGNGAPTLDAALDAGGVFPNIRGEDKASALGEFVRQMPLPGDVDRGAVLELILARERQGTTALGGGIAIPHARGPVIMRLPQPIIAVGYLAHPLDFRARDGQPVDVLFLMATRTIREHTHLLARLGAALGDADFAGLIRKRSPKEALVERLRSLEQSVTHTQEADR